MQDEVIQTTPVVTDNTQEIKTSPTLSTDSAAKSLEISNNLGIDTNPVQNFKPTENLNLEVAPTSTAVRKVANEGNAQASLIKPDAQKLSDIEKYAENVSLEFQIGSKRDRMTELVNAQADLRDDGKDLTADELFELDNVDLDLEELNQKRQTLGLNMAESALTGDLVGVFRDMGAAVKESPVIASSGLLGFFAGPVGIATTQTSISVASIPYNWKRTYADDYHKFDKIRDANGNKISHDDMDALAKTSATIQASLEFGAEMLLLKTSKVFKFDKFAEKVMSNPALRKKMIAFASKIGNRGTGVIGAVKGLATQGLGEAFTEVLQDNTGDFAEALGQTWTTGGFNPGAATDQFAKNYDINKNIETAVRSFIAGAGTVGTIDVAGKSIQAGKSGFDKAKNIYKNMTGKDIEMDHTNDTVNSVESGSIPISDNGMTPEESKLPVMGKDGEYYNPDGTRAVGPMRFKTESSYQGVDPAPEKTFTVKDGIPVYLSHQDALVLTEVIPRITEINKFNIAKDDISKEQLQTEIMNKTGVNKVYIGKEQLNEWADTEEKQQAVNELFLGDKGVYLDAQKVPITPEEFARLQSLGDPEVLADHTALTSTGVTLGDVKAEVKSKGEKKIPKADEIPASGEVNNTGEINIGDEQVDGVIKGYEDFGMVSENVYNQMSEDEKVEFNKQVDATKTQMKDNFRDSLLNEFENTVDIQTREANAIAEEAIIESIVNDDDTIVVDVFMSDKTNLKINPESLTPEQRVKYYEKTNTEGVINKGVNSVLEARKVFAKNGYKIDEVAANIGAKSADDLLRILSTTPSSKQAYDLKTKIEFEKNRSRANDTTEFNAERIANTIENKQKLKIKTLNNMLKANPRAGLKLLYSVFKIGNKTSVDKVNFNAQETTDNTRIGDLSPKSYLNASRAHENRAIKAGLKGADLVVASQELEKSIVADELHKASVRTKAKVDTILKSIVKMSRDQKLLDKLNSTGHLDAFNALTALLGTKEFTPEDGDALKTFLITQADNGLAPDTLLPSNLSPVVDQATNDLGNSVNDLTLSQIETVENYVNQVVADSKNTISKRISEATKLAQGLKSAVVQELKSNPHHDGSRSIIYAKGGTGYFKQGIEWAQGILDSIKNLNEMFDRYKVPAGSLIRRIVVDQIKGENTFDNGMGEKARSTLITQIRTFIDNNTGADTMKRIIGYAGKRVKVPEWIGSNALLGRDGSMTKTEMIGMLLVYGSENGKQRLSKFGIDVNTIPQVLEKYLHPDDIKLVEAVYKAHDLLKPGITFVEKQLKGNNKVEFTKGESFRFNGRTIEGGYIHFNYRLEQDVKTEAKKQQQQLNEALGDKQTFNSAEAAQGFTREGFKKARAENVDAYLDFDLNRMLDRSLGDIVANNTMLIPVHGVMKVLNDPEIAKELTNILGKTGYEILKHNIMRTAKGSSADMTQLSSDTHTWLKNFVNTVGNNYMLSNIVGSVSSVFSQFVTWTAIAPNQLGLSTTIKSGFFMMRMLTNPKSLNTFIENMSEIIPSIRGDSTNYITKDELSFKLYDKSENSNAAVRGVMNTADSMLNFWLGTMMGSIDTFGKTAFGATLFQEYLDGKANGGPTRQELNDMTETERRNGAAEYVNRKITSMFPSKGESNTSYVQRHSVYKNFTRFFNDARIALNYIVFDKIEKIYEGTLGLPKKIAKDGVTEGAKAGLGAVGNALLLQFQLSFIDATLRSLRGEDEEGQKDTDKNIIERWLAILQKNVFDPYMIARGTADMMPIASQYQLFVSTDGKVGELTFPQLQWMKDVWMTSKNLYKVDFDPTELNDQQSRQAVGAVSGIIPLPKSPINSYLFGDSTAFETGLQGAAIAVYSPKLTYDYIIDRIEGNSEKLANGELTPEQKLLMENENLASIETLMQDATGREIFKKEITNGTREIFPDYSTGLNHIIFAESGGNPIAKARHSSARGIGQFLVGTWAEESRGLMGINQAYRDVMDIPDGEIDGRTDPEQSVRVLENFHKNIAKKLIDAGIMPTEQNIYIGHHFGKSMAPVLAGAADDEMLKDVYTQRTSAESFRDVVASNPWMNSNMTIAQFKQGINDLLVNGEIAQGEWEDVNGTFDPNTLGTSP